MVKYIKGEDPHLTKYLPDLDNHFLHLRRPTKKKAILCRYILNNQQDPYWMGGGMRFKPQIIITAILTLLAYEGNWDRLEAVGIEEENKLVKDVFEAMRW